MSSFWSHLHNTWIFHHDVHECTWLNSCTKPLLLNLVCFQPVMQYLYSSSSYETTYHMSSELSNNARLLSQKTPVEDKMGHDVHLNLNKYVGVFLVYFFPESLYEDHLWINSTLLTVFWGNFPLFFNCTLRITFTRSLSSSQMLGMVWPTYMHLVTLTDLRGRCQSGNTHAEHSWTWTESRQHPAPTVSHITLLTKNAVSTS